MKKNKKKLQKLAQYLYHEFRQIERERYDAEVKVKEELQPQNLNYNSYDESVSKKFKNFVLNLIKVKDKIRIEVTKDCIYMNGDLDSIRTNYNQANKYAVASEDVIDIRITKEGFSLCRRYGQSFSFEDNQMYEQLKEQILDKSKEMNKEIIIDMIDDIMLKTNLNRESNLDQILD